MSPVRFMLDVDELFQWLLHGAPGAQNAASIYTRVGEDLRKAGVPLDRMVAFIRTLHPHIMSQRFVWSREQSTQVFETPYQIRDTLDFVGSPVSLVVESGKPLRHRFSNQPGVRLHSVLESLLAQGFTDYIAHPIRFLNGEVHTITLATKDSLGFSDEHLDVIERVVVPLSRLVEIMALRRNSVNLLDTYVGRHAGEQILAGKIKKGDTQLIHAVIWFSDLRGFTALSGQTPPDALIRTLNEVFDCQVSAIEKAQGEVLKFMGDGLFAIFPTNSQQDSSEVCDRALDASTEAFVQLESLNVERARRGDSPVRFGLALHIGEVAYGNIGGAARLDFTCIGPAVNLTARLEGLTGQLRQDIVTSAAFAARTKRPMVSLGEFSLKGVVRPEEVFAPRSTE